MLDKIPGRSRPEQHQEEYCYYHHYLEISHWQQFSWLYVMLTSSSSCFTSWSSKWRQSLLPLIVKTSYLSCSPKLSIFLYLSLWTAVLDCNIVQISARFIANCCQGGCGQTPTLYLADTSAVQSTRSWGIIKVVIMLLFLKSSEILSLNLLLQM